MKLLWVILSAMLVVGCGDKHMSSISSKPSIGVATMDKDGVVVLQIRADLDAGANFGEGYFRYAPTDPNYQMILKHLGGLVPGQSKDVPPWDDHSK